MQGMGAFSGSDGGRCLKKGARGGASPRGEEPSPLRGGGRGHLLLEILGLDSVWVQSEAHLIHNTPCLCIQNVLSFSRLPPSSQPDKTFAIGAKSCLNKWSDQSILFLAPARQKIRLSGVLMC